MAVGIAEEGTDLTTAVHRFAEELGASTPKKVVCRPTIVDPEDKLRADPVRLAGDIQCHCRLALGWGATGDQEQPIAEKLEHDRRPAVFTVDRCIKDRYVPVAADRSIANDQHVGKGAGREELHHLNLSSMPPGRLQPCHRLRIESVKPPSIPLQGSEKETLLAFLDYYRAVLVDKASGISDRQLHTRLAPSSLTLGGLINHMALVEDDWFTSDFAGENLPEPWSSAPWDEDRDWEFNNARDVPTDELFGRYRSAITRSNAVVASADDLGAVSAKSGRDGQPWSLRWILVHLIEETARHCGHADLIRESIDGSVGDFPEGSR